MQAEHNTDERSLYQCRNYNATMRYVCITELDVTVRNIKILSVAQECFYGEFMSPASITRTYACAQSIGRYYCFILNKF